MLPDKFPNNGNPKAKDIRRSFVLSIGQSDLTALTPDQIKFLNGEETSSLTNLEISEAYIVVYANALAALATEDSKKSRAAIVWIIAKLRRIIRQHYIRSSKNPNYQISTHVIDTLKELVHCQVFNRLNTQKETLLEILTNVLVSFEES